MTSLKYNEIFEYFLGNISDSTLLSLNTNDINELMSEYLHKTLSDTFIRRIFSTIKINKDIQEIQFEMKISTDEDSDLYFVKNVLSKGMVIEWLRPQVRNKVNLSQLLTGKEQKFFSQANHISELRAMLEDTELEVRKMIRDRDYTYNSYLEES